MIPAQMIVLSGPGATPPLPPAPSRSQIINVRTSGMQGLTVQTAQYGSLPWWDAALPWLTASDRQAVYAAKRAASDTHCLVQLPFGPPLYDEPNQAYSADRFGPLDWTAGNTAIDPKLAALMTEVVINGFTPVLFLGGDNGQEGHAIAVVQLPLVVAALGPLMAYTLIIPGWDGVF